MGMSSRTTLASQAGKLLRKFRDDCSERYGIDLRDVKARDDTVVGNRFITLIDCGFKGGEDMKDNN
jgi:hypothetical protein